MFCSHKELLVLDKLCNQRAVEISETKSNHPILTIPNDYLLEQKKSLLDELSLIQQIRHKIQKNLKITEPDQEHIREIYIFKDFFSLLADNLGDEDHPPDGTKS